MMLENLTFQTNLRGNILISVHTYDVFPAGGVPILEMLGLLPR